MDPTKLLEADHRMVEELFEKISKAKGDERMRLVRELETSLQAHMELEEQVVYPAMQPVTGAEMVDEGITEHELARKTLREMVALAPEQPGFEGALEAVKAGVLHHVEEEETQVFPQLRKDGEAELAEMATPFMHKRTQLSMPIDANALAKASSKQELLDEARSAGVDGASSMTKEELAEALTGAMSSH